MTICDGGDGILHTRVVSKISSLSTPPTRRKDLKMKSIQIPEELFIALMKYHLLDIKGVQPEIKKGLMNKMDSITMRLLYSKYKAAPTEEEKEKARKEALDKRGVPDSFRW